MVQLPNLQVKIQEMQICNAGLVKVETNQTKMKG